MRIRSPIVGEFIRLVGENPLITSEGIITHFVEKSKDEAWRRRMGVKEFKNETRFDPLLRREVRQTARQDCSRRISYLLYRRHSHLLEGGGNLRGPAQVRCQPRDDGKMGYILTPVGMGSLKSWIDKAGNP